MEGVILIVELVVEVVVVIVVVFAAAVAIVGDSKVSVSIRKSFKGFDSLFSDFTAKMETGSEEELD